jgi:hypothetical protein
MKGIEKFVLGGAVGLLAIIALSAAAHHGAGAGYWLGLLVFMACIGAIFHLIGVARFGAAEPGLPWAPILNTLTEIRAKGEAMGAIEKFVLGGVIGLFAIIALFAAARHGEGGSYWGGLAVFVFMVGLIFYQITRARFDGKSDSSH